MNRLTVAASLALFTVTSGVAQAQTTGPINLDLRNPAGQSVGTATLSQASGGVALQVQVTGLPPGPHGIHFHAVGLCEGPEYASAGGHYNPTSKQHGLRNPQGAHAGDLPNLDVGANGSGSMTATTDRITLSGGPTSVFDADGTALVIHAGPDDEMTDPAGNSGGRVACGLVARAAAAGGAAGQAAQPGQLPRTGTAVGGLLPLAAGLGGLAVAFGTVLRRRAR